MKKYLVLRKATKEDSEGSKWVIDNGLGNGNDTILQALKEVLQDPSKLLVENIDIMDLEVGRKK